MDQQPEQRGRKTPIQKRKRDSPLVDDETWKQGLNYVSEHSIPELFKCLTTSLLFHRPENHVDFLIECLDSIQQSEKSQAIKWDQFIPNNSRQQKTLSKARQVGMFPPIANWRAQSGFRTPYYKMKDYEEGESDEEEDDWYPVYTSEGRMFYWRAGWRR